MKSINLARCERPACAKCGAFQPECDVPLDDGPPHRMCWLCAHAVCHHDAPLTGAPEPCACAHEEIWPADVFARRAQLSTITTGIPAPLFSNAARAQEAPEMTPEEQRYIEVPTFMGRDSKRYEPIRKMIRAGWDARGGRYSAVASGSVPGNTRRLS